MPHIIERYRELYNRLKSVGFDYIIEKGRFDEYRLKALRIIAQLPHPAEVDLEQIRDICKECSSGSLEILFPVADIGNLARQMLIQMDQTEDHYVKPIEYPLSYNPESVTEMLQWNNNMMLNFSLNLNRLLRQTDINLKGRCPFCNGDLVEVICFNTQRQKNELRVRCKQQLKQECRNSDWYMQDVEKRSP